MNTKTAHSFAWTQGKADIALGLVAVAWGSSYLLMKIGLGGMGPFMVIAMRFLIAFAVVGAVSFRKIAHTNRAVLKYASVLGLLLFGLFAFLTHGPVSYTHLDVYKRQVQTSSSTRLQSLSVATALRLAA